MRGPVGSRLVGGGSRLVGGRSRLVGSRSLGVALILDISNVTRVVISHVVGHNLPAAVREKHIVSSIGGVAITGLVGPKVHTSIVVLDGILVLIVGGLLLVGGGGGIGRRRAGSRHGSNGGSKGNEGLGSGGKRSVR